ncbi:c-type cytochrome [Thermithiobacillus tepidarius DSM 3134]|uniref:c-type cytochrome n=1 Tax=Thermithiobacillus tepidarius TaxID=929 RepID=UPI0003F51DD9|nr:c-type cytochrome [Thermithiobacillus tepidarius]
MKNQHLFRVLAVLGTAGLLLGAQPAAAETKATGKPAQVNAAQSKKAQSASAKVQYFVSPSLDDLPNDAYGEMVRKGEAIFYNTGKLAKPYAGNNLNCVNCHLDGGRKANSAPMWAAYVHYPAYRAKNNKVNTLAERLQGCFRFSMNGTPPAADSDVMTALVTYMAYLSKGAPVGEKMAGAGYIKMQKPAQAPSAERGAKVYAANCAVCHGANGEGTKGKDGQWAFPPLWGPDSFNWGAGMHRIDTAAAFIKVNMPLGKGGSLSDQEAWDVAYFMNGHDRPKDPRVKGDIAEGKKQYHEENCRYGEN